jgi:protein-tyrosine-phosphatase
MAEAIARKRIADLGWSQIEVRSAGVGAMDGSPVSEGARRVAADRGLDLSEHRATFLTRSLVDSADLVLTMSAGHLVRVLELGAADRMAMITAFAAGGDEGARAEGVPDPIGGPDEEYARTFEILDELVERVLARLEPVVSP